MGRIKKGIAAAFIFSFLVFNSFAQELDTIYIIDYWVNFGRPNERKSKFMKNDGATIFLSTGDTIFLKATYQSPILKLRWDKKEDGFFEGRKKIQTLRIIKPPAAPLSIRIQSKKAVNRRMSAAVDTTLKLDGKSTSRPYIFIISLRHHYSLTKRTRLAMKVSNQDFVYKNNYRRRKIRSTIMNSVVYEYHYPEGTLMKLKK